MPILIAIAGMFGISVFRLVAYAAILAAVVVGALTIRQHYIDVGWYKHAAKIERQDNAAVAVSKQVEHDTQACSEANGFWDVVTQGCKLQEEEPKPKEEVK